MQGVRSGQGVLSFYEGGSYDGEWLNDKQSGEGTEENPKLGTYTGGWKDGLKNGKGQFKSIQGGSYDGDFLNGVPHGEGVQVWEDGLKYTGAYKYGTISG